MRVLSPCNDDSASTSRRVCGADFQNRMVLPPTSTSSSSNSDPGAVSSARTSATDFTIAHPHSSTGVAHYRAKTRGNAARRAPPIASSSLQQGGEGLGDGDAGGAFGELLRVIGAETHARG